MRLLKHQVIFPIALATLSLWLSGCQLLGKPTVNDILPVELPFVKSAADECYYLDRFMPTPDRLVSGRNGSINVRYYTYKAANYKDWEGKEIVLSFYSQDELCWSLFEEYYLH